mmetsp:Transcript_7984/g.8545  ORF Transcript_7984/g.8545 Transcript_7984/m.8545 type:complete len:174 (+) Transcript_7984:347-868(+)
MDARREANNAEFKASLNLLWETFCADWSPPVELTPAPVPNTTDNVHINTTTNHKFHTTSAICAMNKASNTTMCKISDSTVSTTNTAPVPNIIENTTTVYITNTVHTTDTTDTNKVIETPILSPSPTSNNYYDNIDNKILRTEYEGTIVFEQLLGTNHCLHGYSQQYYYRRLIN